MYYIYDIECQRLSEAFATREEALAYLKAELKDIAMGCERVPTSACYDPSFVGSYILMREAEMIKPVVTVKKVRVEL